MQKVFRLFLILLWILFLVFFIVSGSKNGWQSVTPLIEHNRPQGIFGWLLTILITLSVVDIFYYNSTKSQQ